jgi:hypothetical protein
MAIKLVSSNDNPAENVVRPKFGETVAPSDAKAAALLDSFADYPKTVGEHRSDKTDEASDWTPRDALIAMLRDIDTGVVAPDNLIIVWSATHGHTSSSGAAAGFLTANQDGIIAMVGDMERAKHSILAEAV